MLGLLVAIELLGSQIEAHKGIRYEVSQHYLSNPFDQNWHLKHISVNFTLKKEY